MAVDRIRVLCECLMRETYISLKKTEVPLQYSRADAKTLLSLFRTLPGVSPNQIQGLRDTIEWSDPSHHTDANWQVPDEASINLHITRLLSYVDQFRLKR
jgi:hypothetical protein